MTLEEQSAELKSLTTMNTETLDKQQEVITSLEKQVATLTETVDSLK